MNAEKQKTASAELCDVIFKNLKMNSDRTVDIIKKANETAFREELTKQLNDFEDYAARLTVMLIECGEQAKEENIINKIGTKLETTLSTIINSDTDKLAEVMIEGLNSSETEITKAIREFENTSCSEESLGIAREVLALQEKCIEGMKRFL